jgi:hypothetical protein
MLEEQKQANVKQRFQEKELRRQRISAERIYQKEEREKSYD